MEQLNLSKKKTISHFPHLLHVFVLFSNQIYVLDYLQIIALCFYLDFVVGYICEILLEFLSTADSLPEESDEEGNDAALQHGSSTGSM